MFGGSLSWRIVVAWVGVEASSCWWSESGGFVCVGYVGGGLLWSCLLAELRSFVRRFSCLLYECVRGVCSLSDSGGGPDCAIGQVFWASSWYALSMVMMYSAALSILLGVILGEFGEVSCRVVLGHFFTGVT